MTTTVQVKARAWGALVSLRKKGGAAEAEEFILGAHEDRSFHLEEGEVIEIRQGDEPVPAADEPSEDVQVVPSTVTTSGVRKQPPTDVGDPKRDTSEGPVTG